MRFYSASILFVLLFAVMVCAEDACVRLKLKDGREIEGKQTGKTDGVLQIAISFGSQTMAMEYPLSMIESIQPMQPPSAPASALLRDQARLLDMSSTNPATIDLLLKQLEELKRHEGFRTEQIQICKKIFDADPYQPVARRELGLSASVAATCSPDYVCANCETPCSCDDQTCTAPYYDRYSVLNRFLSFYPRYGCGDDVDTSRAYLPSPGYIYRNGNRSFSYPNDRISVLGPGYNVMNGAPGFYRSTGNGEFYGSTYAPSGLPGDYAWNLGWQGRALNGGMRVNHFGRQGFVEDPYGPTFGSTSGFSVGYSAHNKHSAIDLFFFSVNSSASR